MRLAFLSFERCLDENCANEANVVKLDNKNKIPWHIQHDIGFLELTVEVCITGIGIIFGYALSQTSPTLTNSVWVIGVTLIFAVLPIVVAVSENRTISMIKYILMAAFVLSGAFVLAHFLMDFSTLLHTNTTATGAAYIDNLERFTVNLVYDSLSHELSYVGKVVVSANLFVCCFVLLCFIHARKKKTIHQGDAYSLSTTCFVFEHIDDSDEVKTVLIFNKNYSANNGKGWWLAPGAHIDFAEGKLPEEIAKTEAESEIGAEVEMLKPHTIESVKYADFCDSEIPPHALYKLTIPQNAGCGHDFHIDLAYIAKMIGLTGKKAKKDCCWITLKRGITEADFGNIVDEAIDNHRNKGKGKQARTRMANKYPDDFISRLYQAFVVYCSVD